MFRKNYHTEGEIIRALMREKGEWKNSNDEEMSSRKIREGGGYSKRGIKGT
jgi:hypothetical protein